MRVSLVTLTALVTSQILMLLACSAGVAELPAAIQFPASTTAALVVWLRSVLNCSCVVLIPAVNPFAGLSDNKEIQEIWRLIGSMNTLVNIAFYATFNATKQVNTCRGASLFVLVLPGESNYNTVTALLRKESQKEYFSRSRWMVLMPSTFSGNESKEEVLLRDVYVPFDSQVVFAETDLSGDGTNSEKTEEETGVERVAGATLSEVYHEAPRRPLRVVRWGRWPQLSPPLPLAKRRRNLHGLVLRAAVVDDPPLIIVKRDKNQVVTDVGGFFPLIWSYVMDMLNFTSEFVVPEDGAFGAKTPSGWNGMIRMILRGEVDVSPSPFMMTSSRSEVIRYSVPWATTKATVFIRTPNEAPTKWQVFVDPFSHTLWCTLLAAMLLLAALLWFTHRSATNSHTSHKDYFIGNSSSFLEQYSLRDCALYMWGSFCSQGHDWTPTPSGSRVVYLISYLLGIVIMAAYTGLFIAGLTAPQYPMPFNDLEGFLSDGTYDFSVIARSGLFTQFQHASDPTMRHVFKKHLSPREELLPETDEAAVEDMCSRRVAFMGNADITNMMSPCILSPLALESFPLNNAMVMPRRCPYAFAFNAVLQNLRRSGVLRKQYRQLWESAAPKLPPSLFVHVNLDDVVPLLGLLGSAAALSAAVAAAEALVAIFLRRRRRRRRQQRNQEFNRPTGKRFGREHERYRRYSSVRVPQIAIEYM